jgi:LytTr DNA-binding domain-containing protein
MIPSSPTNSGSRARIVVVGYSSAAVSALAEAVAGFSRFEIVATLENFSNCDGTLEEVVPETLISYPGCIPEGWDKDHTSLLVVTEFDALNRISRGEAADQGLREELARELSQLYHQVVTEKAIQLRSLIEKYQVGLAGPAVSEHLTVRRGGSSVVVPVREIQWMESSGNWTLIHTVYGVTRIRETITDLLMRLPTEMFIRIHRSTAVRMAFVEDVEVHDGIPSKIKVKSGESLVVGNTYRTYLAERLAVATLQH